jgi:hypothetical protein
MLQGDRLRDFIGSIRPGVSRIVRQTLPPVVCEALFHLAGRRYRPLEYQGVQTWHNTHPLHSGHFAELYEKYQPLDPYTSLNVTRYRLYNICMFAHLCRELPGDFLFAGVSYGVAPRVVYDFVKFDKLNGKVLHLIDPFTGRLDGTTSEPYPYYNTDIEYVRRQYSADAPIKFHRNVIPDALHGVGKLAFVLLNTSDTPAECASLPILFDQLSAGGSIIVDSYAISDKDFEQFDPVFTKLGFEPIWLPSGQCIAIKK